MNERRNLMRAALAGLVGLAGTRVAARPKPETVGTLKEPEVISVEFNARIREADLPKLCVHIHTSIYEHDNGKVEEYAHFTAYVGEIPDNDADEIVSLISDHRRMHETTEDFIARIELIFGGGWNVEISENVQRHNVDEQKRQYEFEDRQEEKLGSAVKRAANSMIESAEEHFDAIRAHVGETVELVRRV